MNRKLKIRKPLELVFSACFAAILMTPIAHAHTTVKSSSLEDGGVYQTMPELVDLVFAQKVGLASLSLKDADGKKIDMEFTPPKSTKETFTIPMPRLETGDYAMSWRAISTDGHVLKGDISFTVK